MVSIDLNGKPIHTASASTRPNSSKVVSGYKMNGEARVKSLRLGDALAQLEKIRKQKSLEASSSKEASSTEATEKEADRDEEKTEGFEVDDSVEARATSKITVYSHPA